MYEMLLDLLQRYKNLLIDLEPNVKGLHDKRIILLAKCEVGYVLGRQYIMAKNVRESELLNRVCLPQLPRERISGFIYLWRSVQDSQQTARW
jgi:hypothetical protein